MSCISDYYRHLISVSFKARFTFLIAIACLLSSPFLIDRVAAQQSSGVNLPPPPSVTPLPPAQLPLVNPNEGVPVPGEKIFQAPVSNPPLFSPPATSLNQYRVFVDGYSSLLLQEVRRVEPGAFVQQLDGRRVIQVGVFRTEANARQQMAKLAAQGVPTQIAVGGTSSPIGGSARRYYVVVPGSRSTLPELRDRAIRLGVQQNSIQLRDQPLGPHVAIGPFGQIGEAETMQRYLRDKGSLDTRVFFDR
ncbi:SPOR domain-containing protein [Phormidesmis priestleyi]